MTITVEEDGDFVLTYTDEEVTKLVASVNRNSSSGGFQNLQARLNNLRRGNVVRVEDEVLKERIIRYATRYGDGGFQKNIGGLGRYGVKR